MCVCVCVSVPYIILHTCKACVSDIVDACALHTVCTYATYNLLETQDAGDG